jgi:hypothetical protein
VTLPTGAPGSFAGTFTMLKFVNSNGTVISTCSASSST